MNSTVATPRTPTTNGRCSNACETNKSDVPQVTPRTKVFVPRVDIVESDDHITLAADIPGVDDSSLTVSIEKNVLTLRGQVQASAPEGYQLAYSEYDVGDFERSFTISNDIDRGAIEAVMKDGVLRLKLPKAQHAMVQKIAVKTIA